MFQHLKLNGASHTMNQQKTDLTFYNWKRVNRLGSLVIISCNLKPLCVRDCVIWIGFMATKLRQIDCILIFERRYAAKSEIVKSQSFQNS